MGPLHTHRKRWPRWRGLRVLAGALSVLVAGAVGAAWGQPTAAAGYVVGPEDVVKVTVFGEDELSGRHLVDVGGTMTVGLIGRVTVKGLTLREIEQEITKRLANGFLINPQVTAEIEEHREQSVVVLGEVAMPGIYPHSGNLSLIELLAKAGGVTAQAGTKLQIVRPLVHPGTGLSSVDPASEPEVITIRLDEIRTGSLALVMLRDGDRVNVPRAAVFFVTGQVASPGFYVWTEGMTVEQAIALAGGYTARGSSRGIRVRRMVDGERVEVRIEERDVVQPDDTVHVRPRLF